METAPDAKREANADTEDESGDADRIPRRHRWLSLQMGCVLVSSLVLLLLLAFVLGPVRWARQAAIACTSRARLNQLAWAMLNYHDAFGCLPPAYVADESGKPLHSWRVLILPFFNHRDLYEEYSFREPWDGPNNRKLADRMPKIFHCPSEPESGTYTNLVVIRGPGTAFPDGQSTCFADFRDGQAETILAAEIANSSICWLEPRDLDVRQMSLSTNDESRPSISCSRPQGPYVVFADSIHCYWLSKSVTPDDLKALTTIAGQEPMFMAEARGVGLESLGPGPATDAAVRRLERRQRFDRLWLSRSSITDVALVDLTQAVDLDALYLQGTRITDAGIEHLKALRKLEELDLSETAITDESAKHLKTMSQLRDLKLNGTGISDAALKKLVALKGLCSLELRGTTVSDSAICSLKAARPSVRVVR